MHAESTEVWLAHARLASAAVALVAAMLVSAWIGRRNALGLLVLALVSFAWLTVDKQWEGPHLLRVADGHSVVAADLVGFAGLVVAVVLSVARVRSRRA